MMEEHTLRVIEFDEIISKLKYQAASSLGQEICGLIYPTNILEVAKRKQKETAEARAILDLESNIPLGGISDIRPLVSRASVGAMLQPSDLLSISSTLNSSRRLHHFLIKLSEKYRLMGELASEIEQFIQIENSITSSISSNAEVMDSASHNLAKVRADLRITHSRMMEKLQSYLQSSSYKTIIQEPVITIRNDRYCIPIKADHRGSFPGIVHDASSSGASIFVEPAAVVELGNKRKELEIKERDEVEKVLVALTNKIGEQSERILATITVVGIIDCIAARAKLAISQGASEPVLNDRGYINLYAARHPLLEGSVVPIDMVLGDKHNALLITGPNTGGKTVSLKTIGLLSLMAACGLQIPAEEGSELCIFDNIYADIGDEQSIAQSLSTFSAHLKNIVRITDGITNKSLVLLDEVGAGTDPAEGAALAKSVIDYILNKGAKLIATTHYGELKEFAFVRDGIQNASVEFNPETLMPTYKLLIGVPGSSNAFAIASRLGLNSSIVQSAKDYLVTASVDSDELIRKIEESHRIASEERILAQRNAADAQALKNRYEEQLNRIDSTKSVIESKVRKEARGVIEEYSRKLDQTLQELAKHSKDSKRSQSLKKKAEALIEQIDDKLVMPSERIEPDEAFENETEFYVGKRVRVRTLEQDGEIIEPPDDGKVVVMVGMMKITVPVTSLAKPKSKSERKQMRNVSGVNISMEKAREFVPEIHLRAKRVEPALVELDKYMDDAMAAGAMMLRVVHGKGTGVMRKAVWDYLRSHPGVDSFRLGNQDEGSNGVTIVFLK